MTYPCVCSEQDTVFASLANPPSPATTAVLTSTIARRLTPQPIKLRADIELTCYTPAGIDAIKKALRAGEKESNETVPIKAKLVAPPLYVLSTNATDKVRHLEEPALCGADVHLVCCDRPPRTRYRIYTSYDRDARRGVGREDEGKSGLCPFGPVLDILSQPKAVSETEEQDLAQLMAKAGEENAEVSGDEDEEEGV